jgi:hypothetical protein
VLSSPDRDDDLLQERLRALHDVWPGDPADDDPLRATRRATAAEDSGGTTAARPPVLLRLAGRAVLRRLGSSASGLPLPPRLPPDEDPPPARP